MVFSMLMLVALATFSDGSDHKPFVVKCGAGEQAFLDFLAPLDVFSSIGSSFIFCKKFEEPSCVESCYWAGATRSRTRADCGYHWDVLVDHGGSIYYTGKKAVYVNGFAYNDTEGIDQAYCCISSGSKAGFCKPSITFIRSKYTHNNYMGSRINMVGEFPDLAGQNPIVRSFNVEYNEYNAVDGSKYKYTLEACETEYNDASAEQRCAPADN